MQLIEHFLYKAKKHQNLFLGMPILRHIFTQKEAILMLHPFYKRLGGATVFRSSCARRRKQLEKDFSHIMHSLR
jgi:hypothetical protein